jgi:tRNA nucleotidyltransferase (CCA-adding enzyme)
MMEDLAIQETVTNKKLVTTETLIKLYYPVFTRRNITAAIIKQRLPYMQFGRKRYFNIADVEKWFEDKQKECMRRDYSTLSNL